MVVCRITRLYRL